MDDRGFYVTLACNASLSVYPENRISSYTTRLAKTINLKGEWQVGLAEIEYPRSWYSFNATMRLSACTSTQPRPRNMRINPAKSYLKSYRECPYRGISK